MMVEGTTLNLFISYSHEDNRDDSPYIEEFIKHLSPLVREGLVTPWYDRRILPGRPVEKSIDMRLEEADIVCLLVSSNFLFSKACNDEKEKALELRRKKGISVISIILAPCAWEDDRGLYELLALPTDGKPVSDFPNRDAGWKDVYNGIKKVVQVERKIRQLQVTESFQKFLQDTQLLTKAHSKKETVFLRDIFLHPELDQYDSLREFEEKISARELTEKVLDYSKIIIAGEVLAGKTALCKILFQELREKGFIPVYLSPKHPRFSGKIKNRIARAFTEQYEGSVDLEEIEKERIIPIKDDFHLVKNKERDITGLAEFPHSVLIVDDIFGLNIKEESLVGSYVFFRIRELKPSARYDLVKKWMRLTERGIEDNYKDIDRRMELINSVLGKNIGKGIMPSYPFFILSSIVVYETFLSLDQEITSQGYCYQALIYFYLAKQGVKSDEVDIYINFLTELAFYIYNRNKRELNPDEFSTFMSLYLDKYNLPVGVDILLRRLDQIFSKDSFNNYSFRFPYIYYFFVAKYLVENLQDENIRKEIEKIMNNLHVDENAYIAVFMIHHSKDVSILEEIELNALLLFDQCIPATLTRDDVTFFDKQAKVIINAALPPGNRSPESERKRRLKVQDKVEKEKELEHEKDNKCENDELGIDLRRAIKTVEVIGCILKNRAGSLEKKKLEEMFEEAMLVHLRIMSSFFEIIKDGDEQKFIVEFLIDKLEKIVADKEARGKDTTREELRKIAEAIFWNLNFLTVFGMIHKIVRSLGSEKLSEIVTRVCDQVSTPASFLVKNAILMWYKKNLRIDEIDSWIKRGDVSEIAKKVMRWIVADYCSQHAVNYKDRQRIQDKLGIRPRKFI